jgi:hypothetical protein
MSKRFMVRLLLVVMAVFIAQAIFLYTTGRKVRLSFEPRRVYIYEGDLVSDTPPENADRASRTVEDHWELCSYWTGLTVRRYLLPPGNCPTFK